MIHILTSLWDFHKPWGYEALKPYLKQGMRVVILPLAYRDTQIQTKEDWDRFYSKASGRHYESLVEPLLAFGIEEEDIQWFNAFTTAFEEAQSMIHQADLLYFTGGLPDQTMVHLQQFNLLESIQAFDGTLLGFSAGAMIQLEDYHVTPDEDYSEFGYYKGLKGIRDFNIEVHYEGSSLQQASIERVLKDTGKPVYALTDQGVLIVADGVLTPAGQVAVFYPPILK